MTTPLSVTPNYNEIANSAIWEHGAQQKEQELAAFLRFTSNHKISTILEIGSDSGGTLFAWSKMGFKTYAVDLWHGGFSSGRTRYDHGATVVPGNSHDPETFRTVSKALGTDSVDCLFIDGDHTYTGISNDFWMYKRLVRSRGYIAIHDICEFTTKANDIQVHRFWDYLKKEYPDWERWEFKQFPENWGGIGIVRNYEVPRTSNNIIQCKDRIVIPHPMSGDQSEYDLELFCDYPVHHNLGVSSQHHERGVYWW